MDDSEVAVNQEYYKTLVGTAGHDLSEDVTLSRLLQLRARVADDPTGLPFPSAAWLDRGTTTGAVARAYSHLAPATATRFLQIGGRGTHALKFLLAGAREAVVVTPVVEELDLAKRVAVELGFRQKLHVVCGIAEELPFPAKSFDRIYSGSSLHHTRTEESFPEISRVLRPGGRFASVDIYRSPLYGFGTRVFGRATRGATCQPLDDVRIRPAIETFGNGSPSWHGRLVRYPTALASRLGSIPPTDVLLRLEQWEDALVARIPAIDKLASLVVIEASAADEQVSG